MQLKNKAKTSTSKAKSKSKSTKRKSVSKSDKPLPIPMVSEKRAKRGAKARDEVDFPDFIGGHFVGNHFELLGFKHTDGVIHNDDLEDAYHARRYYITQMSDTNHRQKNEMLRQLVIAYKSLQHNNLKGYLESLDTLGRPLADKCISDIMVPEVGDEPGLRDFDDDVEDGVACEVFGTKVITYEQYLIRINDVIDGFRARIKNMERQHEKELENYK